ncbi:putative NUDIX hydrolase domain-containing protein [Helianthus anomalus]
MSPPPPTPPSSLTKPHPTSLSDLIFSAFSLFVFYSSSPNFNPNPNPNPNRRRFFKFPIMPLTTTAVNKLSTTNRHHFATPQSLSDWLRPRLPSDSFAAWGTKPGTKNVHNLWLELADGETSLADSTPPVRTVEVVVVRVRGSGNRYLIESHQELSNGDLRNRSRPLSEKMKPGETVEQAVVRAVKEELGSIIKNVESDIVRIVADSYTNKVEERVSVSYPGLPACYILHTVDAYVDGLPEGEFWTEEGDEYEGLGEKEHERCELAVSCKKHYWKWVDSGLGSVSSS